MVLQNFIKLCLDILNLVEIRQKYRAIYVLIEIRSILLPTMYVSQQILVINQLNAQILLL